MEALPCAGVVGTVELYHLSRVLTVLTVFFQALQVVPWGSLERRPRAQESTASGSSEHTRSLFNCPRTSSSSLRST